MKVLVSIAVAAQLLVPATLLAQDIPAAQAAPAAAFSLDTPIEALAANEKAKAVLDADLPDLLPHPSYEMFKGMSLRTLQPMSQGALTDEILAKVEKDLAAIK